MHDTHYGFRDYYTGEPTQDPEWTKWDYALASAFQVIEDFSDANGLLAWEKDSPKVDVLAVAKVDRFENAKERASKIASRKKGGETPGTYYVPELKLLAKEWPTMREQVEEQIAKQG